jgi:type IV pilus assembly protein PilW
MLTNVATAAEELLEGVESMQILYGDDSTGDGLANRYITANAVTNWNRIVTVRVGLLVHTPEQVSPETDNRIYNVAGTVIGTSGAVQHAADQRMRFAFNSTVKIRNRGVQ